MLETRTSHGDLQVVLLGAEPEVWQTLQSRLASEGVRSVALPVADYTLRAVAPSGVGAAVIDFQGLRESQKAVLHKILERLVAAGVPVVQLHADPVRQATRRGVVQTIDTANTDMMTGVILAHVASAKAHLRERFSRHPDQTDLAEQLKMAGRVQRDFLPAKFPDSDGFRWGAVFKPAEWVSGDIYDVARLDEQHVGFYLADAVGHSMPAALLTMFLKQAIVMRETNGNSWRIYEPAEVLTRLNILMTEQALSGCQFATVCYCLLNIVTRELRFARAGHPYPVLMRTDGECRTLENRGPLLGVFRDSAYCQERIVLGKGDKLILYSDGAEALIGRTNDDGLFEFSPSFKAMSGIPLEEMMQTFDRATDDYEFPEGQRDDITVLGLEVLG